MCFAVIRRVRCAHRCGFTTLRESVRTAHPTVSLELTSPVTAENVSLHNRVRLGGAL